MSKVVYKYGTGQPIPDEAKYLCTREETTTETSVKPGHNAGGYRNEGESFSRAVKLNTLVWHYYELSVPEEKK